METIASRLSFNVKKKKRKEKKEKRLGDTSVHV